MTQRGANHRLSGPAFTLVELILVMAILATVMALSAPSLSRSLRQRKLSYESARLLAVTEFARDEAVAQGIPMVVWFDPTARRYGVSPKVGFPGGSKNREYALQEDVSFGQSLGGIGQYGAEPIEFAPDGILESTSLESVQLVDRYQSEMTISKRRDGWGYEVSIQKR